ncbi:MAG: HAMP domain-containing sensor histidine kinase [Fulvivirga sp.]
MRLILKITIIYLLISFVVFLLGGIITFEVINREVDLEEQRFLRERLSSVSNMIERRDLDKPFKRDKISIEPLTKGKETEIVFSDTLVMHATLQRMEPHVKLDVVREINNKFYKISLYDLIVEEDDIAEGVQESLIKMYVLLTVVVLILSGLTSLWLLKPFNKTLGLIKDFSLQQKVNEEFPKSNTTEFDKLNRFLNDMTLKMKRDYQIMKEFTENAAHEMQTPISIANGKLEMLINSDNITDEQSAMIASAQNSLRRLSKLNEALSLLTKIDNQEFEKRDEVNISTALERQIYDFEELINLKSIALKKKIEGNVKVNIDQVLCGIMITNLLQNAIRHNVESGELSIVLSKKSLKITNTGEPLTVSPQELFDRFKKGNQSKQSLGLGLAIVKKICDVNDFTIEYTYDQNRHRIEIIF